MRIHNQASFNTDLIFSMGRLKLTTHISDLTHVIYNKGSCVNQLYI